MPPVVIDLRKAEDTRDVVHRAVQALAEGQLVAFPTETVYGLGASARHPEAVERLAAAKGRPENAPFSLAIKGAEEAADYVPNMSPLAQRLARRCWPGPVTLVLENGHRDGLATKLPAEVNKHVCPNGTLGLRVAASWSLQQVLRLLAGPIVLSSANRSGEPDSITAEQVVQSLGDEVALVLDDGPCRYGQPSSVVQVDGPNFKMLREGVVSESTLQRMANLMVILVCTGNTCRSPMAETLMRTEMARLAGCKPEELDEAGVMVLSAGIAAAMGAPPSLEAVEVMREQGFELKDHESRPLSEQLVRHADLILTMTDGHRRAIVGQWPEAGQRTKLLLPDGADVADPIGRPMDVYRQCAQQIKQGVEFHASHLDTAAGGFVYN